MENLKSLYTSLLKTQEEFFEELAESLKKDFYYIKKVIAWRASLSFDLDRHYTLRLGGVCLVLSDGIKNYDIYSLDDLYVYLNIRSSSINIEEIEDD